MEVGLALVEVAWLLRGLNWRGKSARGALGADVFPPPWHVGVPWSLSLPRPNEGSSVNKLPCTSTLEDDEMPCRYWTERGFINYILTFSHGLVMV